MKKPGPRVGIDYVWDFGLIRRVRKSDLPHIRGPADEVRGPVKKPKPKPKPGY